MAAGCPPFCLSSANVVMALQSPDLGDFLLWLKRDSISCSSRVVDRETSLAPEIDRWE
jgi:hypothetical protein